MATLGSVEVRAFSKEKINAFVAAAGGSSELAISGSIGTQVHTITTRAIIEGTDSGTPTLGLTVAQTLEDTRVLGEIANAAYGINVEDTAANILAHLPALAQDANVASIAAATTLTVSVAQFLADRSALDKVSGGFAIVDTAAAVAAA